MKVTVERGALLKALGLAASVVERKNTIPVLSNVLLEAEGDELRLTATDLELQISMPVPAQVAAPGATTVQAALLQSIVRETAEGAQIELELDPEKGRLHLAAARSRYKLQTLAAGDFPKLKPDEDALEFGIASQAFKEMLAKVAHAQSTDPARYYLNGAQLEAHAGALVIAATNGNLLAHANTEAPEGSTEIAGTIIPRKTMGELADLLADAEGETRLAISAKQIRAQVDDVELTSKLIDGSFPDWRRVVPASNPHKLRINREAFAAAVRRSSVISSDKTRSVQLELTEGKLTVRTTSHEHGEGLEEVPADWSGPDLITGFNARYLLDTFAAMGGADIEVRLADPGSPALFINPTDLAAQWVVMPMRTSGG